MHVNARQGMKEMDDMDVNKERLKLGASQILTVQTMRNADKDLAHADLDLRQKAPFALTLMSVKGRRIFVVRVLLARTK